MNRKEHQYYGSKRPNMRRLAPGCCPRGVHVRQRLETKQSKVWVTKLPIYQKFLNVMQYCTSACRMIADRLDILDGCAHYINQLKLMHREFKQFCIGFFFKYIFMGSSVAVNDLDASLETLNCSNEAIRYLAWHSKQFVIAIALQNDEIRIYNGTAEKVEVRLYNEAAQKNEIHGCQYHIIYNEKQRNISCMAWRPVYSLTLAVADRNCIYIWSKLQAKRRLRNLMPTIGKYKRLVAERHQYITALDWSKDGQLLASAALADGFIIIWAPLLGAKVHFMYCSAGFKLVKWSHDNRHLFAACNDVNFMLWNWRNERRVHAPMDKINNIQAAAWSMCGQFLYFVCRDSTKLMRINLQPKTAFRFAETNFTIECVTDLSTLLTGSDLPPYTIAIDALDKYLAVMYKKQPRVDIYCILYKKWQTADIQHLTTITAEAAAEYVVSIRFPRLRNYYNLLTIVWNTGRITYYSVDMLEETNSNN